MIDRGRAEGGRRLIRRGTILVIEDDAAIVEAIRVYLERSGFRVEHVADGAEAMAAVREFSPALIVLDLMLPGRDGLSVCRSIRATSATPIAILTARSHDDEVIAGLDSGADDYIVKPFSPRQLVARIEAILRRTPDGTRLRLGRLAVDLETHRASVGGGEIPLTTAELKLLASLMRWPNRIFGREEIKKSLGEGRLAGLRSVDGHVVNLRRKLELAGVEVKIETIYGMGYRIVARDYE